MSRLKSLLFGNSIPDARAAESKEAKQKTGRKSQRSAPPNGLSISSRSREGSTSSLLGSESRSAQSSRSASARREERLVVGYNSPVQRAKLAHPDLIDSAARIRDAMQREVDNYNDRQGENPGQPLIELKPVDLDEAYLQSASTFHKRLKNSGFLKSAPLDLRLGINSYAERRHIIENAVYARQDRAVVDRLTRKEQEATGRSWMPKLPTARWKARRDALKEEQALVDAKKLFEYSFRRVRDESLLLAGKMVPAGRNAAGLVDGWKLSFLSEEDLENFFKRHFSISPPKLDKKERAGLNETQRIELRAQRALRKIPLGEELWKNATRFKQTEWDAAHNPRILGRPSRMQLPDGSVCEDISKGSELKYRVKLPNGGAMLTLSRDPSSSSFQAEVQKPDGTTVRSHEVDFESAVKANFPRDLLTALFEGGELKHIIQAGTFQEVYGRMQARNELEGKVEQWLHHDLAQEISNRLKDAGNPVMFEGTDPGVDKGMYVMDARSEAQTRTMKQLFAQAGKGNLVVSGLHVEDQAQRHGRDEIAAGIEGGVTLRQHRRLHEELEGSLEKVKAQLDDPDYSWEAPEETADPQQRSAIDKYKAQRLYRGVLQPSSRVDAPAPNERGEANPVAHEGPDPITNVEDVGEIARVTFSEIEEVEVAAESNGEPTREQLLEAVQQQLGAWVEGMDDVINQPGDRVALDRAVQLFFRPWPDRLAMTAEAKATSGISDTLAGMSEAAHSVHGSAAAIHGMLSGSMIGGALLTLAGIRELKDGSTDMRRLKKLIEPLKAYRDVLKELHQELASSGSGQAQEVVGSNLKGVEARLRAARQQVAEALVGMPTSASLAVAGGLSIAGGATAMAHASVAAGALGAAYGSLVTAYGVTTAVQSGQRLKDLRGLLEKVNGELDQDSSLRQHLTVMLGHEMDARKHEIAGRSALAAAGAASAGLQIAGLALAVPTVGTSLGLTAAGVAMGAAGAAAFRPIKSRHRGLNAVGGVEMTTGLPATFLYEPEHLEHLTSKINDQGDIAERCRREIIEHATAREDDGLRQFKYTFRLHRALAKVIPSADRSALANRMVSHPQSVADASLQFMLGTTEFERHYLEQQKVPALEKEVRHLMDEFNAPATENPEADRTKKALIGEILAVKADALMVDSARLEMLQDLEQRLNRSKRFLGTEFLRDSAYRKEWEDLQVDFIVAHDLAAEALSRKRLNSVQRQLDARADGDEKVSQDPLRDALRKHVGARFARVFAHAYPEKVAYERRGALEVARAMFMADMKNERTEEGDAQPA